MFSFRQKHKYTAYHDTNKDHNYIMDTDDNDTESFLNDDFEDMQSDDNNDDLYKENWPKSKKTAHPQNKYNNKDNKDNKDKDNKDNKAISNDNNNRYNKEHQVNIFSFPDPEINESRHNVMGKKSEQQNTKKPKFMSRMIKAIKNKTKNIGKNKKKKKAQKSKKGKYDKTNHGEYERSVTPLNSEHSDYDES